VAPPALLSGAGLAMHDANALAALLQTNKVLFSPVYLYREIGVDIDVDISRYIDILAALLQTEQV